jgi:hypothetical protein
VLFLLLVLLLGFSFYKKLFMYSILLVFAAVLQYLTHRGQIKFNLGHVFFLAIIIARLEGRLAAALFIIFAGFLPQIPVGNLDLRVLLGYPWQILIVSLSVLFPVEILMFVGIILAILNYSVILILSKAVNDPLPERITEIVVPMVMNIIYFASLLNPVKNIIGLVIGA